MNSHILAITAQLTDQRVPHFQSGIVHSVRVCLRRVDADGLLTMSARLDGLRPAAAYSLRLTAANHVGLSPHSEPLMFTTLEEGSSSHCLGTKK